MPLKDLILEIFEDCGAESSFDELTETDQRRLCAAYLRENDEVVLDLLQIEVLVFLHLLNFLFLALIFVLQFFESDYNLIQKHQMDLLQKSLEEIEISCPNFDYLPLKEEKTINKLAETLKEKLNRFMSLRLWADEHGSSLLHLGTLNSLTGLHRILAAQLVGTPAGLTIDKMNQKLSKDENKNIEEALQDLLDMGFINKKRIDESNFKYLVV
ncbi:hypothetical protein LCGC14_2942600 [marine sediment metagenome]|uniref:Uncharacterized protein n=1 Tax=marine sediment metagenome TaxID=412755 RepID=A0A0F8XI50_9ZZZZ